MIAAIGFYFFSVTVVIEISRVNQAGPHKIPEERVGLDRPGLELRMELAGEKPGMVGNLKNLNKVSIG